MLLIQTHNTTIIQARQSGVGFEKTAIDAQEDSEALLGVEHTKGQPM